MPSEIIGEFGTAGAEREWIVAEIELAIRHLKKVCGEPPRPPFAARKPYSFVLAAVESEAVSA